MCSSSTSLVTPNSRLTSSGPELVNLTKLIDAYLGRKEEALREGRRAVELVRAEKDVSVEV
jgi:hypothetical protein